MTTPRRSLHHSRSGLLRGEANVGTSSPLSRASSTPYQLYNAARGTPTSASTSASSPFVAGSPYASNQSSWYSKPTPNDSASPVRRKNTSFGSPGIRASPALSSQAAAAGRSENSNAGSDTNAGKKASGRRSAAFVRRKTLEQRVREFPADLLDRLSSLSQTLEEHLADPALGYPLGLALHAASLLSHLISPSSDLSLSLLFGIDGTAASSPSSVFAGGPAGARRSGGGVRRAIQQSRASAWLWMASCLSLLLVAVATWNAFHLVSARRRYRLWMRSSDSKVASNNSRLVPIQLENEDGPSLQERVAAFVLERLGKVPVLGWFVPDAPDFGKENASDAQIHELNVWQSPEVSLRVACVYSPLHAFLWHVAGTQILPLSGFLPWITFILIQGTMAAHLVLLATLFSGLVKDKTILAAEVMHEYDEKFVLPRAMPSVRDACVQTSQAETISPSDWTAALAPVGQATKFSPRRKGTPGSRSKGSQSANEANQYY